MYKHSFNVKQEVEVNVEVTVDDVMENLSHDELFEALMQDGYDISTAISDMDPDDVLDELGHTEVINWTVGHCDTDEVLEALKECDEEGLREWVEANIKPESKPEPVPAPVPESKPEPVPAQDPLWARRPAVELEANQVRFMGSPNISYGTYTYVNNMLCVNAFGVQFIAASLKDACNILSALALDVFVSQEEGVE